MFANKLEKVQISKVSYLLHAEFLNNFVVLTLCVNPTPGGIKLFSWSYKTQETLLDSIHKSVQTYKKFMDKDRITCPRSR